MKTEVTVLMAVYNAAPFLDKSLRSLLEQTLTDWQAVCVDDASTDDSLAILRRYAELDSRISVLSLPENRGQAYARNEALPLAAGRYVCFLDADDWFAPDALAEAVATMESHPDNDTVLFTLKEVYPDHTSLFPLPDAEAFSGREAFRLSLDWHLHGVYMTRAEIHRQTPYDTTCRLYSDENTTPLHYLSSRRVAVSRGVYHYRKHPQSSTQSVTANRFLILEAGRSMRRQLQQMGADDEVLTFWESFLWYRVVHTYQFYLAHRRELTAADRAFGLGEIHRSWLEADRHRIRDRERQHFCYRHRDSWTLFRLQEWLYHVARRVLRLE